MTARPCLCSAAAVFRLHAAAGHAAAQPDLPGLIAAGQRRPERRPPHPGPPPAPPPPPPSPRPRPPAHRTLGLEGASGKSCLGLNAATPPRLGCADRPHGRLAARGRQASCAVVPSGRPGRNDSGLLARQRRSARLGAGAPRPGVCSAALQCNPPIDSARADRLHNQCCPPPLSALSPPLPSFPLLLSYPLFPPVSSPPASPRLLPPPASALPGR